VVEADPAQNPAREGIGVPALIDQLAAAEKRLLPPPFVLHPAATAMTVAPADIHQRSKGALIHELAGAQQGRMEAMVVSDLYFCPIALGSLLDREKLGGTSPRRLFDRLTLAGRDSAQPHPPT